MDSFATPRVEDDTDARKSHELPTPTTPTPAALQRARRAYAEAELRHLLVDADCALRGTQAAAEVIAARPTTDPVEAAVQSRLAAAMAADVAMVRDRLKAAVALLPALGLALTLAAGLLLAPAGSPSAEAAVRRADAPRVVVVDSDVEEVRFPVTTTAVDADAGWHRVSVFTPNRTGNPMTYSGEGFGPSAAVDTTAYVDRFTTALGPQTWTVRDDVDGGELAVQVQVVRRSAARISRVAPAGDHLVRVTVWISHFDLRTGRYARSNLSPFAVQVLDGRGRWVRVGRLQYTGAGVKAGRADVRVRLPYGPTMVRVVRPLGRDVSAATSSAASAMVLDGAGRLPY